MIRSLIFLTALALAAAPAAGETMRAKQAILVEHPSGRVLFERAADQEMAPSSMTKLMTLYLAFEALKAGRVSEATTVKIGKRAFYEQAEMQLGEAYGHTSRVMVENLVARDADEGISAFVQKRTPSWEDR